MTIIAQYLLYLYLYSYHISFFLFTSSLQENKSNVFMSLKKERRRRKFSSEITNHYF